MGAAVPRGVQLFAEPWKGGSEKCTSRVFPWARRQPPGPAPSNIEIFHVPGIRLDEFLARFDLVAHEGGEHVVGGDDVF